MILININLCSYPTNWYILIHINLCHKKEIESWRYPCPAGCRIASLRPLVVPPSCPAPSIAIALTIAPYITCRRRAVRCRRAAAAAAAAASALLPPRCRRRTVRRRRAAVAAALPPSCRHRRYHRCRSIVCWLVVALLSAVRFCHHMPSCDRKRSHCRREHFCTNWYVLIWKTSILAIDIATRTNCTNSYKN
jgi:hypothetical protein